MKAKSVRQRRVADLLQQEIGRVIQCDVRDPRVGFVTVVSVDISPDLRNANVYIHVHGSEKEKKDTLIGLEQARSHIRTSIAPYLSLRRVPDLRFVYDDALDQFEKIDALLKEIPHGSE